MFKKKIKKGFLSIQHRFWLGKLCLKGITMAGSQKRKRNINDPHFESSWGDSKGKMSKLLSKQWLSTYKFISIWLSVTKLKLRLAYVMDKKKNDRFSFSHSIRFGNLRFEKVWIDAITGGKLITRWCSESNLCPLLKTKIFLMPFGSFMSN